MPRVPSARTPKSSPRVPSYRHHKPTGQAVVTLNGHDVYLGKWETKDSRAEYDWDKSRFRRQLLTTDYSYLFGQLGLECLQVKNSPNCPFDNLLELIGRNGFQLPAAIAVRLDKACVAGGVFLGDLTLVQVEFLRLLVGERGFNDDEFVRVHAEIVSQTQPDGVGDILALGVKIRDHDDDKLLLAARW